jgi:hypothetical protein
VYIDGGSGRMERKVPENFIEFGVEKGVECWAGEIKG